MKPRTRTRTSVSIGSIQRWTAVSLCGCDDHASERRGHDRVTPCPLSRSGKEYASIHPILPSNGLVRCGDSQRAGVAAFDRDDRVDEFFRRSLRAGTPMTSRREEPPIFAFLERLVESEQGSGLQDDGELRNSAWRHEQ